MKSSLAQRALRVDERSFERGDEFEVGLEIRLGVRELLDELVDLKSSAHHSMH